MNTEATRNIRRPSPLTSLPSLCLACSSSLPPRKGEVHFLTPCCSRPICPTCLKANPRLARYNPCLHCLGGAQVVSARSPGTQSIGEMSPRNIDGGVHDEDVFTIGDDNEDDDHGGVIFDATDQVDDSPPAALDTASESLLTDLDTPELPPHSGSPTGGPEGATRSVTSSKYYIQPGDTLLGIALRFGIDGHQLCRMNTLPPSTLRTTPHLLHTRTVLILPPHVQVPQSSVDTQEQSEHDARRKQELAEKRLQVLTKEVDWRVAKAYVALANVDPNVDEEVDMAYEGKAVSREKVGGKCQVEETLEGRAIDRYLDDEEWEQRERREGRGVSIQKFPLSQDPWDRNNGRRSSWWKWKG